MKGREGKESAPLDLNPGDATASESYRPAIRAGFEIVEAV